MLLKTNFVAKANMLMVDTKSDDNKCMGWTLNKYFIH